MSGGRQIRGYNSGFRHSGTCDRRYRFPRVKPSRQDRRSRMRSSNTTPLYEQIAREVISTIKSSLKIPLSQEERASCIDLIDKCPFTEPLALCCDAQGFDVSQYIVGKKDLALLEYLLQRGFDIGLNSRKCSSLLNIACSNSIAGLTFQEHIVELLLNQGASVHHKATLCYPRIKHRTAPPVSSYDSDEHLQSDCYHSGGFFTSLQIALQNDNLPIVRLLVNHEKTCLSSLENGILQYACQKNAIKCLPFLIKTFPKEINGTDAVGKNMIQTAFYQSEECGMLFLTEAVKYGLHDEIVNGTAPLTEGSVFHYILHNDNCIRFVHILNKLFEVGFKRSNLNLLNKNGYTTLHLLVVQISKKIQNCTVNSEISKLAKPGLNNYESVLRILENLRKEHIFATMKILLENGVSRNAINHYGDGVLHLLLHNCVYNKVERDYFERFTRTIPHIVSMLEYLLRHDFDLNISSVYCSTPMNYIINTISSDMSASEVDTVWQNVWYVINLFLKYGADPNIPDVKGVPCTCVLLTTLHRWLNSTITLQYDQLIDTDLPIRLIIRIQELIGLFLQNGLQIDEETMDLCCQKIAILANIQSTEARFMTEVRNLYKPFFLHGINPNAMMMITQCSSAFDVPFPMHAQYSLARSFIVYAHSEVMFQFMSIFSNTLHQEKLNSLLTCLCLILKERLNGSDAEDSILCCCQIERLKQNVRSLKILARIRIAESLNWKIQDRKSSLPLPKILQDFISQI